MNRVVVLCAFLLLGGCYMPQPAHINPNRMEEVDVGSEGTFRYFEIDGMPCITRHDGHQGGLTCDWSKFDKNKFVQSGWIAK